MPWIKSDVRSRLPRNAIVAGRDKYKNVIYIGRTMIDKNLLPCSVIPARRTAYTTYLGERVLVEEYEILCGDVYKWVYAINGEAPAGAVIAGRTAIGEDVFIGRVSYDGALLMGMVVPTKKGLLIAIDDREEKFQQYDVACLRRREGCAICGKCTIS